MGPYHRTGEVDSASESATTEILIASLACLLFLFNLVAVSTLLLIIKLPVTPANTALAALLTLAFVAAKSSRKVCTSAVAFGLIAVTVALVSFYYDPSWDGNVYHKLSAGLIKTGWNPVYEQFRDYANGSGRFLQRNWDGFYDGYPKASYIISACLYAATGSIESGKAYTLLATIGAVGIIAVFLAEISRGKVRLGQSALVAVLMCVNAATMGSIVTSQNDGFLAVLIFTTLLSFIYLTVDDSGRYNRYAYLAIFVCVTLGVNLKYSALFPLTIMCVSFLALLIVSRVWPKCGWMFPTVATVGRNLGFLLATAFCGLVLLGATSYLRNLFIYRNPLYPMIGANKEDVLGVALPPAFRGLSPIRQFFGSLFSAVSHDPQLTSIPLKFPFTFTSVEARSSLYWGARTGGWGIWFSGIMLASLVAYAFAAPRAGKALNTAFAAVVAVSVIPAFFIPGLGIARYWPLPALIPPFLLFMLFAIGGIKGSGILLAVTALAANMLPPAGGLLLTSRQSLRVHHEFTRLQAYERQGGQLAISLGPPYLAERENPSAEASGYRRLHVTE
ncbi:MAG: hypothetical protein ACKOI2_13440, partial [Actinomycetota bacterium]